MTPLKVHQKVFGIGLSKTGTTSFTKALNILGVRSIHFPHDIQTLAELQRAEYRLSILDQYQGASDTPIAPYFAQLDAAWPDSKFVLTVREKSSWLASAEAHWNIVLKEKRAKDSQFRAFCDFINTAVYGCTEFNAERFSYVYDLHVRTVREYFVDRPDDFIILDICGGSSGWVSLCSFLGTPIPADRPFPHEYRSGQRWADRIESTRRELLGVASEGDGLLVIDQPSLGDDVLAHWRWRFFPDSDGKYGGNPADDAAAIEHLESELERGETEFLIVGWPSFWWLQQYPRFIAHIERNHRCVLRTDNAVVWSLT